MFKILIIILSIIFSQGSYVFSQSISNDSIFIISNELSEKEKSNLESGILLDNGIFTSIFNAILMNKKGLIVLDRALFNKPDISWVQFVKFRTYLTDSTPSIRIVSKDDSFGYDPKAQSTRAREILQLLNGYLLQCYPCGSRWRAEEVIKWTEVEMESVKNKK